MIQKSKVRLHYNPVCRWRRDLITRSDIAQNERQTVMRNLVKDDLLKIFPEGRIDSENAAQVETEIFDIINANPDCTVAFDLRDLKYISSAGLRVLLKVRKKKKADIEIANVSDEVYEVFELTKFTHGFKISKKMRTIFLDRADLEIKSLNGGIYPQKDDTMVKIFNKGISLNEIKKERETAQDAMLEGVPTLIPYDVVMIGDKYGIIYEAAGSTTLAAAIKKEPDRLPELAERFADFLHEIHSIEVEDFPDIKDRYREWLEIAGSKLEESDRYNISALLDGIPDSDCFIHGNINPSNVIVNDDELLLMDMSGAAHGHSIFDLQALYASLVEMEKEKPMYCSSVFKMSYENCLKFWEIFFKAYMKGRKEEDVAKMTKLLQRYYILKQKLIKLIEE